MVTSAEISPSRLPNDVVFIFRTNIHPKCQKQIHKLCGSARTNNSAGTEIVQGS